jgi:toxin secretion/phage lysis holin
MTKSFIVTATGAVLGALISLAGGWDTALQALVVFMILDYLTGVIVAAVFHASNKTKSGKLSSVAGIKGIAKKVLMLFMVVAGQYADVVLGIDYFRTAVIIALIANELISLIENAGLAGIEVPVLSKAVEALKAMDDKNNE